MRTSITIQELLQAASDVYELSHLVVVRLALLVVLGGALVLCGVYEMRGALLFNDRVARLHLERLALLSLLGVADLLLGRGAQLAALGLIEAQLPAGGRLFHQLAVLAVQAGDGSETTKFVNIMHH